MEARDGAPRGPVSCWHGVAGCLFLACLYVGSLYVWRSSLPRDHPSTIKRRCASVLLVSALSPVLVKAWTLWAEVKVGVSVWGLMGLRLQGLLTAAVLPLLLTAVLYAGPLVHSALDPRGSGGLQAVLEPQSWRLCVGDAVWLRNQVVAPVTEELVFRGAMLPVMVSCSGPTVAIFVTPLFFGVAHFHHVMEQWRLGRDSLANIMQTAVLQFLYTTVFGAYTAFIFIRTGHLAGPILCHCFCNSQGLPDLGAALQAQRRAPVLLSYVLGALLFLLMLSPLTEPSLYGAAPICSLAPNPSLC